MAHIIPFKGVLYNQKKIKDLCRVVTPPYDVISTDGQKNYYEKSAYNIIRLDLGKENKNDTHKSNKYTRACSYLGDWLKKDILYQDKAPAFYFHTQTYKLDSNLNKTRSGFIALVKIEDFESGVVLPHEKTFKKVTSDRLELIRNCRANLSQVFALYPDKNNVINKLFNKNLAEPYLELKDEEGSLHRLWKITDKSIINHVVKNMKNKSLFIADGHHRYETALQYRNERKTKEKSHTGKEPYNFIMMYLSNMDDTGLTILPTHRVIKDFPEIEMNDLEKRLEKYFRIKKFPFRDKNQEQKQKENLIRKMEKHSKRKHLFGLYLNGSKSFLLLTLKDKKRIITHLEQGKPKEWVNLDVVILHYMIIHTTLNVKEEDIVYVKDTDTTCELVNKGMAKAAILLNPTKISEVKRIASLGERMPHKSTYFYPKILTGLVINLLDTNKPR